MRKLPFAVCCFITAFSPLLSSAESKETADSSVGIATSLLAGSQQDCFGFLQQQVIMFSTKATKPSVG
jgi:hypothetical protein